MNSNLQKQLEKSRLRNTSSFIFDINNDNEDEAICFGYSYTGSNPSGLSIYKYINGIWKEIFNECYFGWDDFYSDKNYLAEEWFAPKPFPYDFVEYKGKIGLRTRLKSSQKKRYEGQYDELQCCSKGAFAVLPKSPLFFKPCKTSLYDPPFGNNCKCMQFIAFDYLYRYPLS